MNLLQEQDRVEVIEHDGEIFWKYAPEIFGQFDLYERKIYRLLKTANDEGASHIELRTALNKDISNGSDVADVLTQAQVNGILKKMEKGGYVKAVKGQQQNRKKVYLLSDV